MELYNAIIKDTIEVLSTFSFKNLKVNNSNTWAHTRVNEIILSKEASFELGGNMKPSVNYQCVTTSKNLILKDEILLYGKDLQELKGDIPYARIVLLNIDEIEGDDQAAYKAIKELEFIKYNIHLSGYMMRASTMDRREQVRVSRKAIKDGISFEKIGNTLINEYKNNSFVNAVRIVFITEDVPEFKQLVQNAKKVDEITRTLNHVLDSMNLDCNHCNLKPICDEVEGMRELHFKSVGKG